MEDCWCSLDFASLRIKNCRETVASKLEKSKNHLNDVNEKIRRLEAKLSEERIITADASSNTDFRLDMINNASSLSTSVATKFSKESTGESNSCEIKCNILEKVMEMRTALGLKDDSSKKRSELTT